MVDTFKKLSSVSLRVKISGLALLVNLAVAAGAFFNMTELSESYKEQKLGELTTLTKSVSNGVAAQFYERYGDVQAFAQNEAVKNLKSEHLEAELNEYIKLYGAYDLIVVLDKNGNYMASNTVDSGGKAVNKENLAKYKFFDEPWFNSTLKGQFTEDKEKGIVGTFVKDVHLDPSLKAAFGEERFSATFATQIKNHKNEVVGVIVNKTNSRWYDTALEEFFETVKHHEPNLEMYILNKEGHPIAHHQPSKNPNKENKVINDVNFILKENYFSEETEISKALFDKKSGTGIEINTESKDKYVVGYSFINSGKWITNLGWSILIKNKEKETLASVNQAMFNFYLVGGVISFFMFLISTWAGIFLSRSVEKITVELAQNSTELGEAAAKIAVGATELSESVTEQSAALQETMATTDEISSMIEKNADAAQKSKNLSAESKNLADQGQQTMDSMLLAINEIEANNQEVTNQMSQTNEQLTEITKLIHNISNKTKVINEIVFQTKLLSFNASVEAARAGEYGKGFAVVAEEVGKLAQMSGAAAKEISDMLQGSVGQVEKIIHDTKSKADFLTQKSREKVSYGSETAKQCKLALEEIATTIKSVDQLVSEIAAASKEQSSGVTQIAQAMGQLESVTNQNSSVAQSSSASSEQLKHQSEVLSHMVEELSKFVSGKSTLKNQKENRHQEGVSEKTNVLKFNAPMAKSTKTEFEPVLKNASGYDAKVPSGDDPGFEE